jgi:hypothetical protein
MDPQQQNQPSQQPSVNPQYTPAGGASGTPEQPQQFTPASSPTEPPQGKKTGLMVAIVVVVVIILGVLAFALLGSDKKDDSKNSSSSSSSSNSSSKESTPTDGKFQKYDVTDNATGLKFSVSFFKGAKSEEKNGRTFLTVGETGSLNSVYLGSAAEGKIDCGNSPSETMKLAGESTTVCYTSDKTQYVGHAKTNSGTFRLNVAGQKAISIEDAKAIIESVTFN